MKFIIGKKLGMTTLFDETKGALNVTLIACDPNTVTLARTLEKDGYLAVQVETKKNDKKTVRKEFRIGKGEAKADVEALASSLEQFPAGSAVNVSIFALGDKVNVTGVTKAKGFQGVVKRHGFSGGFKTHGGKHDLRKPGSIGSTFPEHVMKGKRMAGRMGGDKMTVANLSVVYINEAEGMIGVRGAVPGVNGRIVKVVCAK